MRAVERTKGYDREAPEGLAVTAEGTEAIGNLTTAYLHPPEGLGGVNDSLTLSGASADITLPAATELSTKGTDIAPAR